MSTALGLRDPGIDIRRLTLALRLCGDPERLGPVARRLDGIAHSRLGRALARARLQDPEQAGDHTTELVFIERLAVHCGGNTAWDDDALASHVARRLALALEARLADPDVLRFRDRPDYVAAAALAISQGRLAQCWWFDEFDGLNQLAASTALRTLVINEGGNGTAALARLAESSLAQVIGALAEGDASRLLAWLAGFGASTPPPFLPLWNRALQLHREGDATARWLAALVAAERAAPGCAGAGSLRLLRGMTALLRRVARGDLLMRSGSCDRATAAALLAGHGEDAAWLQEVTDGEFDTVLAALDDVAPSPEQGDRGRHLATPHGGFFLLLARMHRLDWVARIQAALRQRCPDWPDARRDALCRAIACRVAAVALGSAVYGSPLADAAVVAACGLEGAEAEEHADLAVAALRAVLRGGLSAGPRRPALSSPQKRAPRWPRLLAEAAAVLIADLARTLPGLAASTPAFLRAQALSLPAVVEAPSPGDHETPSVVRLGRAPLDVLLVLAGVKRQRLLLPGVPPIQLREDHSA